MTSNTSRKRENNSFDDLILSRAEAAEWTGFCAASSFNSETLFEFSEKHDSNSKALSVK